MSAFSLQRILPVILVFSLGCGSVCAEEETDKLSKAEIEKLDSLRFSYHLAREEITQKQWVEPMEKLRKGYRERMNQLQLELAKTGALEKALAARAAEKTEPTNKTIDSKVPEVAAVQQIFLDAQRAMLLRVDQSFSELARAQIKKLSTIKGRLTKVNRLDSALIVEQAIKQITPDAKALPASPKKPRSQEIAKPNPASDFEWNTIDGKFTITLFVGGGGKVVIPNIIEGKPVVSIGKEAFDDRADLTSITIPDSVTSIGRDAFRKCTKLTSVTIPDSVTSIGGGAFNGCYSLKSITIGNGVTSIGDFAFYSCSSLKSITIGNGVTSIRAEAFNGCTSLKSITIPDSVNSIDYRTFKGCKSLTSITIGNGVTSIGSQTFYACPNLTSMTFFGDSPIISGKVSDRESTPTIYRKPEAKGWGETWGGRPVKLISEKP